MNKGKKKSKRKTKTKVYVWFDPVTKTFSPWIEKNEKLFKEERKPKRENQEKKKRLGFKKELKIQKGPADPVKRQTALRYLQTNIMGCYGD